MNHHVAITQFQQFCYIYMPLLLNPTIFPQIILKQIKIYHYRHFNMYC